MFLKTLLLTCTLVLAAGISSSKAADPDCLDMKYVSDFAQTVEARLVKMEDQDTIRAYFSNLVAKGFNVPETYQVATPISIAFLDGPPGSNVVILIVFNRMGCAEATAHIPMSLHSSILREASN